MEMSFTLMRRRYWTVWFAVRFRLCFLLCFTWQQWSNDGGA